MSSAAPASPVSGSVPVKRHGMLVGGVWGLEPKTRKPSGGAHLAARTMQQLGTAFPLGAIGLIGADAAGEQISSDGQNRGLNLAQLRTVAELPTSHAALAPHLGASGRLDLEHFEFGATDAKILHLASPLQLPRLDAPNTSGQPRWRTLLQSTHAAGVRVSLTLAGGIHGPLAPTVRPLLPLIDYLFLGLADLEALTHATLRQGATVDTTGVEAAVKSLLQAGVTRWVVANTTRGVFAANPDGFEVWQPHVAVTHKRPIHPDDEIHVLTGGVMMPVHDHWPMDEALKVGVAALAANVAPEGVAALPDVNECVRRARELSHHAPIKRGAR